MKKNMTEIKQPLSRKIEDAFKYIAFAEAGELYSHKQQKHIKNKEKSAHVCVNGETSSGLCV